MMDPLKKIVIIDDEESVRNSLSTIVQHYCVGFEVSGIACNAIEGLKLIREKDPDIVLLDIRMPEGTGFDMLDCMDSKRFSVIFITAFDNYAIRALRYNAIDYLLKPVDIDALKRALEQALKRISSMNSNGVPFKSVFHQIVTGVEPKLAIHHHTGIEYLETRNIVYMEAEGGYTRIVLSEGNAVLASRSLKYYEEILDETFFLRVHHSYLINIRFVKKYLKRDGYSLIMKDGANIPLAVRRKEVFEKVMSRYTR